MAELITNDPGLDKAFAAGLVNRTNLAALMWPGLKDKAAGQKLYKKLHRIEGQSFGQRDIDRCKKVLKDYFGCL